MLFVHTNGHGPSREEDDKADDNGHGAVGKVREELGAEQT